MKILNLLKRKTKINKDYLCALRLSYNNFNENSESANEKYCDCKTLQKKKK